MNTFSEKVLLPVTGIAVSVLLWQLAVTVFSIAPTVLPGPLAVFSELRQGLVGGTLLPHAIFTVKATFLGILFGCTLGVVVGALLGEFETPREALYPVLIGLQSIPLVAIAPLVMVWLGIGIESKVFMVAQACFFPVFVNTAVGVMSPRPALIDLYRIYSASRLRILFSVRIPEAAGQIFSGLQTAVALSLIGCVVAEFIASTAGLGYLIKTLSGQLEVSLMLAALLVLAVLGYAACEGVSFLHRKIVFWEADSYSTARR